MNDTGGGAPPQGGYGGNGHTLDPSDPLAAKVQNESNYSVQKVRIFSNASQIGVAKTQRLANGNVSVSFSGTLQSANTVNGPWTTLPTAGSPYVVTPAVKSQRYFRVIP